MKNRLVNILLSLILLFAASALQPENLLSLGDNALANERVEEAIEHYKEGISLSAPDKSSVVTILSLYTNLGTALSSLGHNHEARDSYAKALELYGEATREILDEVSYSDATAIAAQASFFLGMVYQELNENKRAASAYAYAHTLDPLHWSSMANLGAVLKEDLGMADDALVAYNKAYEILTQTEQEPTDAPTHPKYILAELQYRIGYILMENPDRKCALTDRPDKEVSCHEMASHAMSLALQYHPDHESAKHMLATLTADATMKRASNKYVKSLFDDYAKTFEHSLVEELHYNGYERLRRAVDRALELSPHHNGRPQKFELVIDAGCGTGLVGEQFRNVSNYLIGVDLSEVILEEARKLRPNLYNATVVGDFTQVFLERKPISLIVAADSYIYFGDLSLLFRSMKEALEEGAFAAFTLEDVDASTLDVLMESKPDWRWQLTASGRFAHNRFYVEATGKENDLYLFHYEHLETFRFENGKGVNGHIFVLQKRTTDQEL